MALEIFLMRMHLALPLAKVGAEHRAPFVDYLEMMHSLKVVRKERGGSSANRMQKSAQFAISKMVSACLAKLGFMDFYGLIDAPIFIKEIDPGLNEDHQGVHITLWLMGWTDRQQIRAIAQSALRSAHSEGVTGYVDEYRGPARMLRPQVYPELSDFNKTGYGINSAASEWSLDSDLLDDLPPE